MRVSKKELDMINELWDRYHASKVSTRQFKEINENFLVKKIENAGESGYHKGYTRYLVIFINGREMEIYCKN